MFNKKIFNISDVIVPPLKILASRSVMGGHKFVTHGNIFFSNFYVLITSDILIYYIFLFIKKYACYILYSIKFRDKNAMGFYRFASLKIRYYKPLNNDSRNNTLFQTFKYRT